VDEREADWSSWMKAASTGDAVAYRRLLAALAPFLRAVVRGRAAAYGLGHADVEDVVQETLLAIHLKRGSWDERQRLGPWIAAIARNKLIDALRRRGRRVAVPIDDFADLLPAEQPADGLAEGEAERLLSILKGRQGDVVRAISLDGAGVRDTAERLGVSEGAVRVALHRGLKTLSRAYRDLRE
jgi:RNA polymerase sigma-70 factor, ECF subfamily